jgi:hypothetical protein
MHGLPQLSLESFIDVASFAPAGIGRAFDGDGGIAG